MSRKFLESVTKPNGLQSKNNASRAVPV
ncbi:unnamed protein product, partial [Allacma fusca]